MLMLVNERRRGKCLNRSGQKAERNVCFGRTLAQLYFLNDPSLKTLFGFVFHLFSPFFVSATAGKSCLAKDMTLITTFLPHGHLEKVAAMIQGTSPLSGKDHWINLIQR